LEEITKFVVIMGLRRIVTVDNTLGLVPIRPISPQAVLRQVVLLILQLQEYRLPLPLVAIVTIQLIVVGIIVPGVQLRANVVAVQ
jgi:hypothetical protein